LDVGWTASGLQRGLLLGCRGGAGPGLLLGCAAR
jgi:hypothetical protein